MTGKFLPELSGRQASVVVGHRRRHPLLKAGVESSADLSQETRRGGQEEAVELPGGKPGGKFADDLADEFLGFDLPGSSGPGGGPGREPCPPGVAFLPSASRVSSRFFSRPSGCSKRRSSSSSRPAPRLFQRRAEVALATRIHIVVMGDLQGSMDEQSGITFRLCAKSPEESRSFSCRGSSSFHREAMCLK